MNTRIFYAVLPCAALLSVAANAQTQAPLTQDQQTTVVRTIVRENVVPPTRFTVRKQSKQQLKQIVRKPTGNVVRTTTTTERIVTRPAPVAREQVITAPPATTLVTADPLDLTPEQRTVVFRTLLQQPVQPAPVVTERIVTAPATRPFVTTEPVVTVPPPFEQRVITVPQTTGAAAVVTNEPSGVVPATEIAIGSRIPASVPLYVMPAETAAAAPSIEGYRYALIGDRVYLVDPRDGIVVAMLYQ